MLLELRPTGEEPNYIVVAPEWSETNGGAIFLHRLVHELRRAGEEAAIYPLLSTETAGYKKRLKKLIRREGFATSPLLDTPVWSKRRLPCNAIVVYPEIVKGNPLNAINVARWLLYPPGKLPGRPKSFDPSEVFFKVSDFSDDVSITGGAQPLALWWVHPAYVDMGLSTRSGSCYMMRKGENRTVVHDLHGCRLLDGLSHTEIAAAFNQAEVFYCYDDATMYSLYAALCGCTSIVIPDHYENREQWTLDRPIARYGVGYGLGDAAHADSTRHLVRAHLRMKEAKSREQVINFIEATRTRFGFAPPRGHGVDLIEEEQ